MKAQSESYLREAHQIQAVLKLQDLGRVDAVAGEEDVCDEQVDGNKVDEELARLEHGVKVAFVPSISVRFGCKTEHVSGAPSSFGRACCTLGNILMAVVFIVREDELRSYPYRGIKQVEECIGRIHRHG